MNKKRLVSLIALLTFVLAFSILNPVVAQEAAPAAEEAEVEAGGTVVFVPRGAQKSFEIFTFCLDYDSPFPRAFGTLQERAPDEVLAVMAAALELGIIEEDPLITQLAIQRVHDGEWFYPESIFPREAVQELIDVADETPVPPLFESDRVVNVVEAQANNQITIFSNNFRPQEDVEKVFESEEDYAGIATMTIVNLTDEDLYIYVPMGSVIEPEGLDAQRAVVWTKENVFLPVPQPIATPAPAPVPIPFPETGLELRPALSYMNELAVPEAIASAVNNSSFDAEFTLSLPKIGLATGIEAVDLAFSTSAAGVTTAAWEVADGAVGWHTNSALPGRGGNVVLSGHNSVYGAIFRHLARLAPGDLAVLVHEDTAHVYRVTDVDIIPYRWMSPAAREAATEVILPSTDDRLTLVTCYPDFGTTHRVVVIARPVAPDDPAGGIQ